MRKDSHLLGEDASAGWTTVEGDLARPTSAIATVSQLVDAGTVRVMWLTSPLPAPAWLGYLNGPVPPELWDTQREPVESLASSSAEAFAESDFAEWLELQEQTEASFWRPDGLHPTRRHEHGIALLWWIEQAAPVRCHELGRSR